MRRARDSECLHESECESFKEVVFKWKAQSLLADNCSGLIQTDF
jgi:hypothetical protein